MTSVSASSSSNMGASAMGRCRQWLMTVGRGQAGCPADPAGVETPDCFLGERRRSFRWSSHIARPSQLPEEPEEFENNEEEEEEEDFVAVQSPVPLTDLDIPALPISPVSMPESIETISGDAHDDALYYQEWTHEDGLEVADDTAHFPEGYVDQGMPIPVMPSAAAIARIFSIGQVQAKQQVLHRAWRVVARKIPRKLFAHGADRICQTALRETLAAESSLDAAIRQLEKTKSTRSSSFQARADRVHMCQGRLLSSIHILFRQVVGDGRSRHYRYYLPEDDQVELDRGFSESVLFAAQALARGFQIRGTEPYTVQLREPAWLLCSAWAALRFVLFARSRMLMQAWQGECVEALRTVLVDFDEAWVRFERDLCFAYFGLDDGQAAAQEEEFALLVVLLSEAMQNAVQRGLFSDDDVESMDPQLILALPRLAILHAIVKGADGLRLTEEPAFWWFREFVDVSRRIASTACGWSDEQYRVLESMLAADETDEAWDKFAAAEELAMSRELDSVSLVCEQPPVSCSSKQQCTSPMCCIVCELPASPAASSPLASTQCFSAHSLRLLSKHAETKQVFVDVCTIADSLHSGQFARPFRMALEMVFKINS